MVFDKLRLLRKPDIKRNGQGSLWTLRLLALGISITLWFFVSYDVREEPQRERTVDVAVTYLTPQGYIILDPRQELSITLRGSREAVRSLAPHQVDVDVVFPEPSPGKREIQLGSESVSLPEGLEVVSINPSRLVLELDQEVTRVLPVEVTETGEPGAGALVIGKRVIPDRVTVRGPLSRFEGVSSVLAEISIENRAVPFYKKDVAVTTQDPLLHVIEPRLVRVEIDLQVPGPVPEPGSSPESSR